jgi:hypothetical protein
LTNEASNSPSEQPPPLSTPTSWEELRLHAWITVTILYGQARAPKSKGGARADPTAREEHIRALLGLPASGTRTVPDICGNQLTIDHGIVQKMLADEYLGRVPYLPWVLLAPTAAVEIWRHVVISKTTQTAAVRDYYLVPIADDPEFDGYVIIVENGRIFNLMLFRGSYADTTLRRKAELIYKSYPDGRLCTSGCCASLAKEHRELGVLRGENRRLQLQLREERKARKAAEREMERMRATQKYSSPPSGSTG